MPVYDYQCGDCGQVWEVLQLGRSEEPTRCPSCASDRIARAPSAPYLKRSISGQGTTCCGREERCESAPCSGGGGCHRK